MNHNKLNLTQPRRSKSVAVISFDVVTHETVTYGAVWKRDAFDTTL